MDKLTIDKGHFITGKYMNNIGFIGAGKVGTVLARYFQANSFQVNGFFSSNFDSALESAILCGAKAFSNLEELLSVSQFLFITVSDNQIETVWQSIMDKLQQNQLVFHCSGTLTNTVFLPNPNNINTFSLHPMMAFSSKTQDLAEIGKTFFTIQSDSKKIPDVIDLLAPLKNQLAILSAEDKVLYHAACVMSSNLIIGLIKSADELFRQCHLPIEFAEQASLQLFSQNATNLVQNGFVDSLTGPVSRNDVNTINTHLQSLPESYKVIYRQLSKKLLPIAKSQTPDIDQSELERILD